MVYIVHNYETNTQAYFTESDIENAQREFQLGLLEIIDEIDIEEE